VNDRSSPEISRAQKYLALSLSSRRHGFVQRVERLAALEVRQDMAPTMPRPTSRITLRSRCWATSAGVIDATTTLSSKTMMFLSTIPTCSHCVLVSKYSSWLRYVRCVNTPRLTRRVRVGVSVMMLMYGMVAMCVCSCTDIQGPTATTNDWQQPQASSSYITQG